MHRRVKRTAWYQLIDILTESQVNLLSVLHKDVRTLVVTVNSADDDAALANVDLQNMLQKQQQTLQMMANVSKMLHDTAMAVIRKIES